MKKIFICLLPTLLFMSCIYKEKKEVTTEIEPSLSEYENTEKDQDSIAVTPVSHASFAIEMNKKTIYFDPVGGAAYEDLPKPDLIVLTDIHSDHMDAETLNAIISDSITIVAPQAVEDQLPENLQQQTEVMNNGDKKSYFDISFEAIPMYNLREEAKDYHVKGRGNGYVMTFKDQKVYVSGDTEDIPEMRNLQNINIAFLCMNLPYTMPIDAAADAVLDFQPDKVYPYHYRGQDGLSDVDKFKTLVTSENNDIQVQILNWYPDREQ